jgi:hypothetical protein
MTSKGAFKCAQPRSLTPYKHHNIRLSHFAPTLSPGPWHGSHTHARNHPFLTFCNDVPGHGGGSALSKSHRLFVQSSINCTDGVQKKVVDMSIINRLYQTRFSQSRHEVLWARARSTQCTWLSPEPSATCRGRPCGKGNRASSGVPACQAALDIPHRYQTNSEQRITPQYGCMLHTNRPSDHPQPQQHRPH